MMCGASVLLQRDMKALGHDTRSGVPSSQDAHLIVDPEGSMTQIGLAIDTLTRRLRYFGKRRFEAQSQLGNSGTATEATYAGV